MKNGGAKTSEVGGDIPEPVWSERPRDQRIELPKNLRGRNVHEVWGLIIRLAEEHRSGRLAPLPVTNQELAVLVELYDDAPPRALTQVLIKELRNQRRKRPGRNVDHNKFYDFEWGALPVIYDRGMNVASRYRRRLLALQKRKKRRDIAPKIPTQAEVAMRYVRKRLPEIASLNDKTLANKMSELKDPRDKKPRAKPGQR